jgi:hypothetical protein
MDYQNSYKSTLKFADRIQESVSQQKMPEVGKGLASRRKVQEEPEDFDTIRGKYINFVRDLFTPTQDQMGIQEEPWTADLEFPTAGQSEDLNYGSSQMLSGVYAGDEKAVDNILAALKYKESSGNYSAKNPKSTARGAYQFIDSTWRSLTKQYGVGTEYSNAQSAPDRVQDAVARAYVKDILAQNDNDITKVPLVWYTGNPQGKLSEAGLKANDGLTAEKYQASWMRTYKKIAEGK